MNSSAIPPQPAPPQPPGLTVRLLGEFALYAGGEPITQVNTPRLQALLTYLLLHRQAPQSRRHLAFLFWPDSAEAQALTNLRKQLLYLRQVLPDCDRLLAMDRQGVHWLPGAVIALDVECFRAGLAAAANLSDSQAIPLLREAIACYTGELLPGCYDEWIFAEREALHTQYGHALERLSGLLEAQRNYSEAIAYSEQLLRHDPLHEPTYRRLMRLHALNGDRPAALRVYHTCLTQLREELGVDPDAETQGVYERLLQGAAMPTTQPELAAYAPFVSRQAEWQMLQQRWRIALGGQPQFVLIAGEAGIGKTRLAEELLGWAIHQGFGTARARCYAAEGRLTYAPVIEWLRTERLRTVRPKIESSWLTELARLLPELLQEQPTLHPPEPITQSWQRHHLFEAVSRTLLALDQPLILLVDDLQWCDKETLELLHFLLRHAATLSPTKLLLLGTARLPDEVDTTHPLHELLNPLRGSATLTQLDLARLTESETGELAGRMVDRPLDSPALQQLFRDTAGNPLFVVETIRATQGQIIRNSSSGQSTPATLLPIAESETVVQYLPPKVLAVIQARLGHLSATARELCEWAAIVGRAFTLDLLAAASKIPQDKAVNALDELWQRRIIREQGQDGYDFSHDRIRDVAVAGISRVRRKYLHRCVAEALEGQTTHSSDRVAAQIADHYDSAGIVEKALAYYQQAAETELRIYANREAIGRLARARVLLAHLPEGMERDQQEYALLVRLGPPLLSVLGYGSAPLMEVYEQAQLLERKLGKPINPAIVRILAISYLTLRKFQQVFHLGQQLLQLAATASNHEDRVIAAEGHYVIGVASFWRGEFQAAREHLEQAIVRYDAQHHAVHTSEYGHDLKVTCLTRLAWALWYLGYPDQAAARAEEAVALARDLAHPFTTIYAYSFALWMYNDRGDQEIVERYAAYVAAQRETVGVQAIAYHATVLEIWIRMQWSNDQNALGELRAAVDHCLAGPYKLMHGPYCLATLARAYVYCGQFASGMAVLEKALSLVNTHDDRFYEAELYRLKGEFLAGNSGDPGEIAECFQQAVAISRRQYAKSLELRAATSLARFWEQQGQRAEAYPVLAEIYGWFTEGFDTPDLQTARRMLEQLA